MTMDMRCAYRLLASVGSERYPDASPLASAAARESAPPFPPSLASRRGEQIFHAVERIDRESVEHAQNLVSRLANSMLGHARNERRAPRAHRDLASLEA